MPRNAEVVVRVCYGNVLGKSVPLMVVLSRRGWKLLPDGPMVTPPQVQSAGCGKSTPLTLVDPLSRLGQFKFASLSI